MYDQSIHEEQEERIRELEKEVSSLKGLVAIQQGREERLRTMVAQASDAMFVSDLRGRLIDCNRLACDSTGYSREELLSMNVADLDVAFVSKRHLETIWNKLKPGCPLTVAGVHRRKNGEEFPVEIWVTRLKLESGDVIFGLARDISRRKLTEASLKTSHETLLTVLNGIDAAIYVGDIQTYEILFANKFMKDSFGYDLTGKICWEAFYNQSEPCDFCTKDKLLSKDDESTEIYEWCDRNPQTGKYYNHYDRAIKWVDGRYVRLHVAMDITKIKRVEEEKLKTEVALRHAQKLEAVGKLAAGIAHEINTPAQYASDNIRFLRDGFKDIEKLVARYEALGEAFKAGLDVAGALKQAEKMSEDVDWGYLRQEIPAAIEQSLEGFENVAKIVCSMKELSLSGGAKEKVSVDINRIIENTIAVSRNEWKHVADLKTDFDSTLSTVPCLPGDFNQVMLNMIINAAHAIEELAGKGSNSRGVIYIYTRKNGEWAEIYIKDSGAGISEKIKSRIFDPFFTTKDVGKGIGQGLSIVHHVITKKHGGTITFESSTDRGTTFTIRLPLNY